MDLKNIPQWNDPTLAAGTKVRTALWLVHEVGIGNIFTKEQHRLAFPGIAQADRRLRDLRDDGWVIQTNREDVSLNSNEQRFVAAGIPVWDPAAPKLPREGGPTAKERRAIFSEAGYQCEVCGIAGGESYPDLPSKTAILSLAKTVARTAKGTEESRYLVECKRCRAGASAPFDDIDALISDIKKLSADEIRALRNLIPHSSATSLFAIWAKYRRLSESGKKAVLEHISVAKL